MHLPEGLEIYIKLLDTGTRCIEHEVPESSPLYTDHKHERFIEAVTGKRFAIVLVITSAFDFKGTTGLKFGINIDGGAVSRHCFIKKPVRLPHVFEKCSTNACIDGRYVSIGFTFGDLNLVESLELDSDAIERTTADTGRITVNIERACYILGPTPIQKDLGLRTPLESSTAEVVKGARISHAFRAQILGDANHLFSTHFFKSAAGEIGGALTATFRVRSHMSLVLCKIIADDIALGERLDYDLLERLETQRAVQERPERHIGDHTIMTLGLRDQNPPETHSAVLGLKRRSAEDDDDCFIASATTKQPNTKVKSEVEPPHPANIGKAKENSALGLVSHRASALPSASISSSLRPSGLNDADQAIAKAKKKAKIMLRLEEIELRKQLMELEED